MNNKDYAIFTQEQIQKLFASNIYVNVTYKILGIDRNVLRFLVRDANDILDYTFSIENEGLLLVEMTRIYDVTLNEAIFEYLQKSIAIDNNQINILGIDTHVIDDWVTNDHRDDPKKHTYHKAEGD